MGQFSMEKPALKGQFSVEINTDRIKIVWWDGSGLCLFAKRLEHSHFCWPTAGSHEIRLSYAQVTTLVEGLDWKRVRAVDVRAPQSAG
jgi:transposase